MVILRSKRFRLVSEQIKTARNGTRATRPRPFFRAIFARSLTLVPCSLLRYRKETLATQASIWSIIHLLCACTISQWKTIIIVLSCLYVA